MIINFIYLTKKKRKFQIYETCTIVTNCSSNECDQTANLQCMNNSATGTGWWYVFERK